MANIDAMSVAELEAALEQKRDRLQALADRREVLLAELAEVEGDLASLAGKAGGKRGRPAGTKSKKKRGGQTGKRPKNKLTMKQAVEKALRASKGGLTLKELAVAVKRLGYKSNSDNFENVVYQCVHGNSDLFPKDENRKYQVAK